MQFKRAVLSDALKLYTEKLMLRTPLGACNDNRGTDCHSRLHGFAMTGGVDNGLPQPFTRLRNDGWGRRLRCYAFNQLAHLRQGVRPRETAISYVTR